MITKFIRIGFGQTQSLAIDHFDTLAECEAAKEAVYSVTDRYYNYHICKEYTWRKL